MNDEYEERGIFKQLVLIAFLAWAWVGHNIERLFDSEAFWWWAAGIVFALAATGIVIGLSR